MLLKFKLLPAPPIFNKEDAELDAAVIACAVLVPPPEDVMMTADAQLNPSETPLSVDLDAAVPPSPSLATLQTSARTQFVMKTPEIAVKKPRSAHLLTHLPQTPLASMRFALPELVANLLTFATAPTVRITMLAPTELTSSLVKMEHASSPPFLANPPTDVKLLSATPLTDVSEPPSTPP